LTVTLQHVLEEGKIYIAFQPLVDLETGRVFGYEALVRSEAPEFPHPGAILEAAIKTDFMGQLGRALRRMAIENCPNYPLFLNIHPDEFDEHWLVRPDDSITVHEQDVFLEITESVPLSHYEHCHSVLAEVRRRGAKIAVDDLGAGYSNLKYIADLEPEIVKLDRELIINLAKDTPLHRLVTSIVDLCRAQGAKVVAEGIETHDELKAVIDTGAHYVQGYLLARPARKLQQVDLKEILSGKPKNGEPKK
jgi:EAL domain-containing protein (putative c-di-GMP-specific phosphodiesterase class I)